MSQEPIFESEEVINQEISGQVKDLHVTSYGIFRATIILGGHEDNPVTVEFGYEQEPYPSWSNPEIPIKMGDWLTIQTRVIKVGDLKK